MQTSEDVNARREYWLWLSIVVVVCALLLWVFVAVRSVSVPILFGFLFAYIFHPLINRLERRKVPRTVAALTIVVGLGALLVGGLLALAPPVVAELGELPARLMEAYRGFADWVEGRFGVAMPETRREIQAQLETVTPEAGPIVQAIFGGTVGALGAAAGLALMPLIAFFFLRDMDSILIWFADLIPLRHRAAVIERLRELDSAVGGFVRGQLIVSGVMAVLYAVGFLIVGLPLAIGVGVLAGVGNLIPYLGTAIGIFVATVLTVLHWEGLTQLLLVYAVFLVVQVAEGWFLTPKIVGQATGISPLGVIVAVLIFGELFGFIGLVLAVPLAAVVQLLVRVGLEHYRRSSVYSA